MLAFGTQVRGFKPGRSCRIFQAKKILSGGEIKPAVVKLRHVKEVATFGKILGHFSPIVPPSATGVRSRLFRRWRRLAAKVGTF